MFEYLLSVCISVTIYSLPTKPARRVAWKT